MFKKFLAAATTLLLALGIVTLVAAPASAHDTVVTAAVSCNSGTSATITWSVKNDWSTGSTISTVTGNASPTPSPLGDQYRKNETKTYTQAVSKSDVGTTFTLGITMTWSDGTVKVGSESVKIVSSNFSCGDDTSKKIPICHATASGSNPWVSQSPAASSIITGLGGHGSSGVNIDDIIPPFTYTQGGVDKSYPGNNWDAVHQLIYNNGCAPVSANPTDPTFVNAVCTTAGHVGTGSVTIPSGPAGIGYRYSTDGVHFTDAALAATIPVAVGLTVTVQAYAQPGYTIPNHQTTSWSQKITSPAADHCVVTAVPTWTDSVCTATPGASSQAGYTIPSTTGVVYLVNGVPTTAATYKVNAFPTAITITAQPAPGYTFPAGTTVGWPTFTFHGPGDCRVLATASVVFTASVCTGPGASTDPSFTLGKDTHVVYTVTINGVTSQDNVADTTYTVGKSDSVSVDAVPEPGYRLDPDQPFHQDVTFVAKQCLVDAGVATAAPTSTPTVCIANVPGGITLATYTLQLAEHISWTVSTDDQTFTPQGIGTYDIPQGVTVWVQAVPETGFQILGQSEWSFTSANLGDSCDHAATPAAPDWNDAICHDRRPGHTQASYTVVAATGVSYQVSTDLNHVTWTPATPGDLVKVAPNAVVWIQPIADTGYKLTDSSIITHAFVSPGACEKSVDYTKPTATDATCVAGDQTSGSYTLFAVDHVTYNVRINGTLTKDVAPGTYDVAPGDRVHVTAIADKGWNFGKEGDDTATWRFHFVNDGLCATVPVLPNVTDQICRVNPDGSGGYTDGYVDIPATAGVQYTLDGKDVSAGHQPVQPGQHSVAAIALTGYKLDASYTGPWTVTSGTAPFCGDLPTHPLVAPSVSVTTCAAPTTFVLGNDLGIADAVIWTVDGTPVATGSHTVRAGTSVAVHAEPNAPTYGFAFDQQKDWVVTATSTSACDPGQLKTLALTGSPLPVTMIGVAGLLLIVGLSMVGVQLVRRRREQE